MKETRSLVSGTMAGGMRSWRFYTSEYSALVANNNRGFYRLILLSIYEYSQMIIKLIFAGVASALDYIYIVSRLYTSMY